MFLFEKCLPPETKAAEVTIKEMDFERKDSNEDLRALRPPLATMNWQDTMHKGQESSQEAEQPISTTIIVDLHKSDSILVSEEEEEASQSYRKTTTTVSGPRK